MNLNMAFGQTAC